MLTVGEVASIALDVGEGEQQEKEQLRIYILCTLTRPDRKIHA